MNNAGRKRTKPFNISMKVLVTIFFMFIFCIPAHAQEGSLEERSFMHNDSLRSYLLYVPATYDGATEWPLVINYHGFSIGAMDQVGISQMNSVADTANYLVAYPQGLLVTNPFSGTTGPGWNVAGGTLSENDDVDFSNEVINHIKADYMIDDARIHVTGWSMGANMAYEFICAYSNKVASFAAVSAQMDTLIMESCMPTRAVSFLQMHGTADPIVPFDGAEAGAIVLPVATESAAFWAGVNNCSSDSVVTEIEDIVAEDSSTVTLMEYTSCDDDTEVRFYQVNNGGHAWPGGAPLPSFLGFVNRDINASVEILDFFSRNPGSMVGTSIEEAHLPTEKSLNVYPNPFAERVTIEFDVKQTDEIELSLFNVLGQEVSSIVNRSFSPGRHQIGWSSVDANLPSGLYFLRLKIGDELFMKPVMRIER